MTSARTPNIQLSPATLDQASVLHERCSHIGTITDFSTSGNTTTRWQINRNRSLLQITRNEPDEDGMPHLTEAAQLRFDRQGNVVHFMGGSAVDSPEKTKKFLGLFSGLNREERIRRRIAAHDTTTKLVKFVFDNLDE